MGKKRTVFCGDIAEVVDIKSGEIFKPKDGKIIIEEYEEDKLIAFKGGNFVKLFDCVVPKLLHDLTPTEIKFVFSLVPFISYEDCVIRENRLRNSEAINAKQLSRLLDVEYSKTRRMISSLERKGVIGHHETGNSEKEGKKHKVYTVNPYIFFRGNKINRAICDYYAKSGWKDLPDI